MAMFTLLLNITRVLPPSNSDCCCSETLSSKTLDPTNPKSNNKPVVLKVKMLQFSGSMWIVGNTFGQGPTGRKA